MKIYTQTTTADVRQMFEWAKVNRVRTETYFINEDHEFWLFDNSLDAERFNREFHQFVLSEEETTILLLSTDAMEIHRVPNGTTDDFRFLRK